MFCIIDNKIQCQEDNPQDNEKGSEDKEEYDEQETSECNGKKCGGIEGYGNSRHLNHFQLLFNPIQMFGYVFSGSDDV